MDATGSRAGIIAALLALAVCTACANAEGSPGQLDSSFGTSGQVSFPLNLRGSAERGRPAALAFAPGGKIELVGTATPPQGGEWRMFGARLSEGGALDPSFGSGGSLITSLPPEDEGVGVLPDHTIEAGALEADGAMVAVGPRTQGRLNAAGQFDSTYEAGNTPLNSYAVVQLPGGDMLAGGETPTEGDGNHFGTLERLLPNGKPDPSFGSGGLVTLPNRAGGPEVRESIRSMLELENGELLVAGVGEVYKEDVTQEDFAWLAKITATGALDPSFGEGGVRYIPAHNAYQPERGVSLAREPDGTIVMASAVASGETGSSAAIWGFLADGAPDSSFGTGGLVVLPVTEAGVQTQTASLANDSSGNVYVGVDESARSEPYDRGSYIARLSPGGTLDPGFGQGAIVRFAGPTIDTLGIDGSGRLLLAGQHGEEIFLARLLTGSPTEAQSVNTVGPRRSTTVAGRPKLVSAHLNCVRLRHRPRRASERCTLTLKSLRGKWRWARVVLERHGHRIAHRRINRVRMPATLRFYLPASPAPTRLTVSFHNGRKAAGISIVAHRAPVVR